MHTLNATIQQGQVGGPHKASFFCASRQDPLTPYVTTIDTDVDDREYKIGGRKHRAATLVVPSRYVDHANALALKFRNVDAVDALIDHLLKLREQLNATFTDNDL